MPGASPCDRVIEARRYACQECPAVLTVVPRETVPRRHYAAPALALALTLYGLCGQSHAEVRAALSSDAVVGVHAERRWCTLSRWIDAVAERTLFATLPVMQATQGRRVIAGRAAMAIGAHAPPSLQASAPAERAFFGAVHLA